MSKMNFSFVSIPTRLDTLIRIFLYVMIFWLPYSKAVIEMCVIGGTLSLILKKTVLAFLAAKEIKATELSGIKRILHFIKFPPSPLNKPIFLFLIFAIVSMITSVSFPLSFSGFMRKTLEWFAIYYLIQEAMKEEKHVWCAVKIFIFTSTAVVLDSFVQFYWLKKDIFNGYQNLDNRATASFEHSNNLAAYLCFVLPICFSFLRIQVHNDKKKGRLAGILPILSAWALVLTFSRGAWISIILAANFLVFGGYKKMRGWIVFFCFLILFSLAIFFTIFGKEVRLDSVNIQNTLSWRSNLWIDSLRMLLDRPWFGFGPNTFMSAFLDWGKAFRGPGYYTPTYAHNCYIQIAVEYGVLGFASFLWILTQVFKSSWEYLKVTSFSREKILSLGLLTGLIAFLLHSFVDTHFFTLQLVALFWYMLGLQMKTIQLRHSERIQNAYDA